MILNNFMNCTVDSEIPLLNNILNNILCGHYTYYYVRVVIICLGGAFVGRAISQNISESPIKHMVESATIVAEKATGYLVAPFYITYKVIKWFVTDGYWVCLQKLFQLARFVVTEFIKLTRFIIRELCKLIKTVRNLCYRFCAEIGQLIFTFVKWVGRQLYKLYDVILKPVLIFVWNKLCFISNIIFKALREIGDLVNKVFITIYNTFVYIYNHITRGFRFVYAKLWNFIASISTFVKNMIVKFARMLHNLLTGIFNILTTCLTNIWFWIKYAYWCVKAFYFAYVHPIFSGIYNLVRNLVYSVYTMLINLCSTLYEFLVNICYGIYTTSCNICNGVYETTCNICNGVYEATCNICNGVYETLLSTLSNIVGNTSSKNKTESNSRFEEDYQHVSYVEE